MDAKPSAFTSGQVETLSDSQKAELREATAELVATTVETAVILGKAKIQAMNRDVAALQLKMLGEAFVRGPGGEPDLPRAIDWLNIHIRQLNAVRSAIGEPSVLVRTKL